MDFVSLSRMVFCGCERHFPSADKTTLFIGDVLCLLCFAFIEPCAWLFDVSLSSRLPVANTSSVQVSALSVFPGVVCALLKLQHCFTWPSHDYTSSEHVLLQIVWYQALKLIFFSQRLCVVSDDLVLLANFANGDSNQFKREHLILSLSLSLSLSLITGTCPNPSFPKTQSTWSPAEAMVTLTPMVATSAPDHRSFTRRSTAVQERLSEFSSFSCWLLLSSSSLSFFIAATIACKLRMN